MNARRSRLGGVLTSLLLVMFLPAPGGAAAEPPAVHTQVTQDAGPLNVKDLLTEYAHNPLGLDARRPRFSWQLTSHQRDTRQTAYRIVVSSSQQLLTAGVGDVWNSGKVASSTSVNVGYAGPELASSTRYHWKVQVWDNRGKVSRWSAPAWWETSLLQPSDWHADWIGRQLDDVEQAPPPDLTGSQWIWYPEGDPGQQAPAATRYFRRQVMIPADKTVDSARMLLTVDDSFTAFLDGAEIAKSTSTWQDAVTVDLTTLLRPGANTIAVAGTNVGTSAAGALGVVEVTFTDGSMLTLRTDAAWKVHDSEVPGWTDPTFDDSGWAAALEIAPYGEGIWTCCGGVDTSPPYSSTDPLLRKDFNVTKQVKSARVHMVGLGYHELRINGAKVGDHVFEGDVNDYTKRVGYSTYDVTDYLNGHANTVGVMLGRGFYDVHQSTPLDWHLAPWRDKPKLLFQMTIRYTDGTSKTVVSDSSWRSAKGPIVYDSIFGGEDYDAQRESPGWDTPGFDASAWLPARAVDSPAGRLVAINNDPVKVVDTLRAVSTTEPSPGTYVLDLGHTITGWGRLEVTGEAGTIITLRYGQRVNADGTVVYQNGWHGGRSQTDSYTLKGDGTETWEPRFTFKSFRYVQVEGLAVAPEGGTVVGRSLHSAVPNAGSFSSPNEPFGEFHDGMRRTILGNLVGYPAIDPFYEKSGWTEDVFVTSQTMIYNFDLARFFTSWLDDIRDSQLPSGHIPIIIPSPGWGYTSWGTPSPIWTAVYPVMAWRMYENYGDRRILEEHYPSIKAYIDREVAGLDDGLVSQEFLGDWVAPGYGVPPEDPRLASTAYVYRQLEIVADMADALGHDVEAARYRTQAEHVRTRFNDTFLNEDLGIYQTAQDPGYRQTSNLLPLSFGMVPEEFKQRVLESVVADIRAKNNHLDTGTLGTEVILQVLTRNGYGDVAQAIANQQTFPSWGYWFANGADTMWESWDIGTRSRSHFFMGLVDEWFYGELAGIRADSPGYKRTVIHPYPDAGLGEAGAQYDSVHGRIKSRWTLTGDRYSLAVTIPANTTATVYVLADDASTVTEGGVPADKAKGVRFLRVEDGNAVYEVGSGTYRFASAAP